MFYIANKIGTVFLTLFGVASLVFFLFTVLPGDPAQMMLDQNEDSAQLEIIKAKFGFNLPLSQQYFFYLNDLSPFSVHSKNAESKDGYIWSSNGKDNYTIESLEKKLIPQSINDLIEKRFPLVSDGILRIENASSIKYPIA